MQCNVGDLPMSFHLTLAQVSFFIIFAPQRRSESRCRVLRKVQSQYLSCRAAEKSRAIRWPVESKNAIYLYLSPYPILARSKRTKDCDPRANLGNSVGKIAQSSLTVSATTSRDTRLRISNGSSSLLRNSRKNRNVKQIRVAHRPISGTHCRPAHAGFSPVEPTMLTLFDIE